MQPTSLSSSTFEVLLAVWEKALPLFLSNQSEQLHHLHASVSVSDFKMSLADFASLSEKILRYRHCLGHNQLYLKWIELLSRIIVKNYDQWLQDVLHLKQNSEHSPLDLQWTLYAWFAALFVIKPKIKKSFMQDQDDDHLRSLCAILENLYQNDAAIIDDLFASVIDDKEVQSDSTGELVFTGNYTIQPSAHCKFWFALDYDVKRAFLRASIRSLSALTVQYYEAAPTVVYNDVHQKCVPVYFRIPDECVPMIVDALQKDEFFWLRVPLPKFAFGYTKSFAVSRPGLWFRALVPTSNVIISEEAVPYLSDGDNAALGLCLIRNTNQAVFVSRLDFILTATDLQRLAIQVEILHKAERSVSGHPWVKWGVALAMLGALKSGFGPKTTEPLPSIEQAVTPGVQIPTASPPEKQEPISNQNIPNRMDHLNKLAQSPILLQAIAHVESSGGNNIQHRMMQSGMHKGSRAIGFWGMMPIVVHETIKQDPHLKAKYGDLLNLHPIADSEELNRRVMSDPNLHYELALSHYNRLARIFQNDPHKIAYAWHNGITAAKRADRNTIESHEYVQKVLFHKDRLHAKSMTQPKTLQPADILQIKQQAQPIKFKKNENLQLDAVYDERDDWFPWEPHIPKGFVSHVPLALNDVLYRFQTHSLVERLGYDVSKPLDYINYCLRHGYAYSLKVPKKYTYASFVVGQPDLEEAWLIKVDVPHITGSLVRIPSSLKEYAVYLLADKIFDIKQHVPEMIAGDLEIIGSDKSQAFSAVAIKLLPSHAQLLTDVLTNNPHQFWSKMDYWLNQGILHKLAAFLFIVGDVDAHGNNFLMDSDHLWAIDFGLSFEGDGLNLYHMERGVWIPYILRIWKEYKDPNFDVTIKDVSKRQALFSWLLDLPMHESLHILQSFGLSDYAKIMFDRWIELITSGMWSLMDKRRPQDIDLIINNVWRKVDEQSS